MNLTIIAAGRRLRELGLVQAHSGNISCRLPDQSIIITAAGVDKGRLTEADILNINGPGPVSSEAGMHKALYEAYPQIKAIIHGHPPYATALATAGLHPDWQLLEEGRLFLGVVPVVEHLPAGSRELAQAAATKAAGAKALLLANHGALAWGENIEEALCRLETLEHICRVMLYRQLFAQGIAYV